MSQGFQPPAELDLKTSLKTDKSLKIFSAFLAISPGGTPGQVCGDRFASPQLQERRA